ncbi:hypothetical protein ABPG72_017927 [Tetrahymena utriculariae]
MVVEKFLIQRESKQVDSQILYLLKQYQIKLYTLLQIFVYFLIFKQVQNTFIQIIQLPLIIVQNTINLYQLLYFIELQFCHPNLIFKLHFKYLHKSHLIFLTLSSLTIITSCFFKEDTQLPLPSFLPLLEYFFARLLDYFQLKLRKHNKSILKQPIPLISAVILCSKGLA